VELLLSQVLSSKGKRLCTPRIKAPDPENPALCCAGRKRQSAKEQVTTASESALKTEPKPKLGRKRGTFISIPKY
jgi:hypothetical protein